MGSTFGAAAMAVDNDKLGAAPLVIAATCLLALAISVHLIKQFFANTKCKKPCYLITEPKPQYKFKRVLADNSYSQFKHLKLHAEDSVIEEEYSDLHPYKGEISSLMKNANVEILELFEGCEKWSLEMGGEYVWVEEEAQLREVAEELSNEKVFAVDTEQHGLRSFLGFTALIQISTMSKDYLIDTIILHDVMGLLRPVFANPGICKVFHGAHNDILWLQRDFHIYVVNLFDTAKACDILSKPQKSLAYLLETYCSVATNKLLQREDWRQRPLSEEMIQYARVDAHYLLYIAYRLCTELKQLKNENSSPGDKFHFLLEASRRSNATCLQLFAKDVESCTGELAASSIISRCLNDPGNISPSLCDDKFQELVRQLCVWRDLMARLHDESLRFVLSDNAIITLAAKIPTTETDIYSNMLEADSDVESVTMVPLQTPSPVVCSHLDDLLCLLRGRITNLDDILQMCIREHLGPGGSCPLSAYNYALLSKTTLGTSNRITPNHNGFRASKQVAKMASRQLFVQKFSCKSPVYHNCKIYANDGRLLCYCDQRKLQWYLNRDLAKLVEEDPPSIMLLFEPKGRPEDEDNDFYIQSKKNICVGCGEGNHYLRYRIIPSCYRIHFPEHLKSHRSHDIVLLCVDCHEIAHTAAEKYKKQVAAEFGIPLFIRRVADLDKTQNTPASSSTASCEEVGVSPLQLRIAAMALLRHGPRMPSQRREELMQTVMTYYGGREISDEDLEKALLVGMSPHERRRFEKKRGYVFKHLGKGNNSIDAEEDDIAGKPSVTVKNASNDEDEEDSLHTNMTDAYQQQDYDNILDEAETSTQHSSPNIRENTSPSSADADDAASDTKMVSAAGSISISDNDETSGSGNLSNGVTSPLEDKDVSLKHDSKMSLLGHGPHGKQVVEYLLRERGEDGVREFCQRWRHVFVDALHPRFLPGGWDVKHRI
ncbi:protein RRP6-like 3 isoform X2 [Salvia miltiorrhiza]|uniref:protein RRP6-like 3 isoform X2 n=1 Tax=Salvia miltiorrhiza TaxID=226208 RepID=UPI0025ACFD4E|nr:protein RRP6-like 3 isoform X2 [Salvia miltiorrhiza]